MPERLYSENSWRSLMVMLDCPGEDAGAPDVVDDLVDARGDLVGPDQRTEESMPCSLEVVLSVEAFTDVC